MDLSGIEKNSDKSKWQVAIIHQISYGKIKFIIKRFWTVKNLDKNQIYISINLKDCNQV